MNVNINCIYNDKGAWCTNKKIKRSLLGLGARCCIAPPWGKGCDLQIKYTKPNAPPPPPQPKLKRYYREWLSSWGWGVMMAYDTVMANSVREAMKPVCGMYAHDNSFELIQKVPKKYMDYSDEQLSKIYGVKE